MVGERGFEPPIPVADLPKSKNPYKTMAYEPS